MHPSSLVMMILPPPLLVIIPLLLICPLLLIIPLLMITPLLLMVRTASKINKVLSAGIVVIEERNAGWASEVIEKVWVLESH